MPNTMPATRQLLEFPNHCTPALPARAEPSPAEETRQSRILIVDPSGRQELAKLLRHAGHKVESVNYADTARSAFERHQHDLIAIGQDLPDCSGLTLAASLRQRSPSCRLLLLAASCDAALLLKAMRSGINDVLVKPFEAHQARQCVARLTRSLAQDTALSPSLDRLIAQLVGVPMPVIERALILHTLTICRGNRVRAALSLGIPRRTLYNRLADYGIESPSAS